jgi:putative DNA primase/helicase
VSAVAAALGYARRGWPVFPCRPWPDKRPLSAHGFKDATTDEEVLRRWWSRWPNALIGTPTGLSFVAFDVDPRHGGAETLAGLARLPHFGDQNPDISIGYGFF